jgi:cytochrome c peroxidase
MLKRALLFIFAIIILGDLADRFAQPALGKPQRKQERSATVRLGERLFRDDRFSTPKGDLPAACSHCHLLDEDPQGLRAYTDFLNRSWVSSRVQDRRRLELRNSPTIFDVAEMPRLHYDGEFGSLEDLVKGTLSGRPMGWLPGEESQAFEQVRAVLLKDKGEGQMAEGTYRDQFKKAFGVEIDKLGTNEAVNLLARAVADFMRTLKARKDSSYDKFVELNGLESRPANGENVKTFAGRVLAKINSLESKGTIKLSAEFNASALQGLKIFFTTDGSGSAGNCVVCHAPPMFTDNSFHNKGVSQLEYDRVHGEGKFAALQIPNAASARRPSAQFREMPSKGRPGEADLGFWNFVDLKNSALRRGGESDDHFLQRMIGALKTPTLRNLKYSNPYFHDGSLHTVEEVLDEMMRLGEMARAGRIREADDELAKIRITSSDIAPLAAFMNALNEDLKRGY